MDTSKLMALMAAKKASMKKVERTAKVAPGKNRIRLLPGWRTGEEHVWFHDFGQHFIKNAADEIQAVYVCANATFEKDCPVCNAIAAAGRSVADDATAEVLGKAKASRTVLVNALMLDSNEPNTPVILELKRGVFGQIVEIVEEWGMAALDPEGGQEIVITRDGKGLNTKYTAQISPKKYQVPAASLTKLNNLDEYVKQESDEQQRRAIAAVNSVAGVLAAPAAGAPAASSAARLAAPKATGGLDDLDDLDALEAAAPAGNVALDSELDDLLGDLPD